MKPSSLLFGGIVAAMSLGGGACSSEGFGKRGDGRRLVVDLVGKDDVTVVGTRLAPRDLSIDVPQSFRIVVRALDRNGNVDPTFNGFVRISSKPGAIERIEAPEADGRSLRLTGGESPETEIRVTNAYGTTFILADDLGYVPTDPLADPPPSCSNGIDDDGDGKVDFPTDEGCAFANDDSETGGTYEQGASTPIFYRLPRIADVRGLKCTNPLDPTTCSGNGQTPYQKEQIFLDTGFHDKPDGSQVYDFDMVVTRIATDGFYVGDVKDGRGGFNNVFSFNFSSPPGMRVCDRLKTFAGTATEFFGFTQISYPTWTLEQWDPQARPCGVPEPRVLTPFDVDPTQLLPLSASLVRAENRVNAGGVTELSVMVTPKLGAANMERTTVPGQGVVFVPSADATNCDFNKDGKIDFSKDTPEGICADRCLDEACTAACDFDQNGRIDANTGALEGRCSDACSVDAECSEYSNFIGRSTFRLTLSDANGGKSAIQADASQSIEFKPLAMRGIPIRSFTGTLHFFSGGAQYTIEARCKDDIIVDLASQPLPSDKACVFPRTVIDENPQ